MNHPATFASVALMLSLPVLASESVNAPVIPLRQAKGRVMVQQNSLRNSGDEVSSWQTTICSTEGDVPVYDLRGLEDVEGLESGKLATCETETLFGRVTIEVVGLVHFARSAEFPGESEQDRKFFTAYAFTRLADSTEDGSTRSSHSWTSSVDLMARSSRFSLSGMEYAERNCQGTVCQSPTRLEGFTVVVDFADSQ